MATPPRIATGRRLAAAAVLVGVTLAHGLLGHEMAESRLGEGAADRAPRAIDVAFVRELAPSLPPVAAPPLQATAPVSLVAPVPEPAASAADAAAAPAETPAERLAEAPPEQAASATAPAETAPAAEAPLTVAAASAPEARPSDATGIAPAASAASTAATVLALAATANASAPSLTPPQAPPPISASPPPNEAAARFDWPPSTRLSYRLEGQYRGPLHGTARVEWLREGSHYQVRLVVEVAPVFTRRMLSDGVVGPQGLSPRRYDEETDVTLRAPRRSTVFFHPDRIQLANGKSNELAPGVQDAASQFVQMTWLFLTRPELLRVGQAIEFPLALPRRVGRWAYEVTEQVTLRLPFGEIETWRLQPRPGSRKDNELSVEMWIAPSLQYLPVRIALQQDAETHLELNLESRPLQAAPPP